MKKIKSIIAILLVIIIFTGCTDTRNRNSGSGIYIENDDGTYDYVEIDPDYGIREDDYYGGKSGGNW